ncbi:hypothetical protein OHS58_37435 [Amycolatopsis sp. NBC_00348]|uniref:hypothetical protein n=1 Tax=Amycolatopsis sp. NBC_00348 TaxID=2975956 RepID=UPI002E263A58
MSNRNKGEISNGNEYNWRPLLLCIPLFAILAAALLVINSIDSSEVIDWVHRNFDASAWIAALSAVVAILSFWQSRRSANVAHRALPLAERSAEAASASASAAEKSVILSEAQWKQQNAPKWRISVLSVAGQTCTFEAKIMKSLTPINVTGAVTSLAWYWDKSEDVRTSHPQYSQMDFWTSQLTGNSIIFSVPLPPGREVVEVEAQVQILSIEASDEPGASDRNNWYHYEAIRWNSPDQLLAE